MPVRPTTDLAKEALFNILSQYINIEEARCLDLCSGTGSVTVELASRGAIAVEAVDLSFKCITYLREIQRKYELNSVQAIRSDMYKFIKGCANHYDFIFSDPPYNLEALPHLATLIFERGMVDRGGLLVIEHPSTLQMAEHPHFVERRKYGYSSFSFYQN